MKAAVYNPESQKTSFLSIIDINKPELQETGAIVKVSGVGVCGSDLLKLDKGLVKPGTVLGHELVGVIDQISETMTTKYGLKKGDRIVSSHHVPCLECEYCINGKESLCKQFKITNFNPGAFCEYLELSERHLKYTVQKVPEHLSDEEASFTEPLACCIKAVQKSGILDYKGKTKVSVIGLGSIGLLIGQLIKHYKPNIEVYGIDLLESKWKIAAESGFDFAAADFDLEEAFSFIFLCAGANATIDLAIKKARPGANITVFSSVNDISLGFANNDIYYKELTVQGSYSPNLENLDEALELIANKKIQVSHLISHKAGLDHLGERIVKAKDEDGIKAFLSF